MEFDMSFMSNKELENQLQKELSYYQEDYDKLSHILIRNIPRKYAMRIISKMYRLRN